MDMINEREIVGGDRDGEVEISIVLPCFNEEKTIVQCIQEAKALFEELGLTGTSAGFIGNPSTPVLS